MLVRKKQFGYYETVALTSEIYEFTSILKSVEFPNQYESNQARLWIIRFPELHFIKLVFTHVDLNTNSVTIMILFFID
jgi:hypothetical protein